MDKTITILRASYTGYEDACDISRDVAEAVERIEETYGGEFEGTIEVLIRYVINS